LLRKTEHEEGGGPQKNKGSLKEFLNWKPVGQSERREKWKINSMGKKMTERENDRKKDLNKQTRLLRCKIPSFTEKVDWGKDSRKRKKIYNGGH